MGEVGWGGGGALDHALLLRGRHHPQHIGEPLAVDVGLCRPDRPQLGHLCLRKIIPGCVGEGCFEGNWGYVQPRSGR